MGVQGCGRAGALGVPGLWASRGCGCARAYHGVPGLWAVQVQGGPGCVRGLSWKRALEEQDLAKGRRSPGHKKEETVQRDPQIMWGS